jgi:hypothetical protein
VDQELHGDRTGGAAAWLMVVPMKILVLVAALVVALAWPISGQAQGAKAKAKARSATTVEQTFVHRPARVGAKGTEKPCAARTWAGCQGWDPDPHVRSMIQMDAGRDDH